MQDQRSQQQNREKRLKIFARFCVYDYYAARSKVLMSENHLKSACWRTGDRSERIRTFTTITKPVALITGSGLKA